MKRFVFFTEDDFEKIPCEGIDINVYQPKKLARHCNDLLRERGKFVASEHSSIWNHCCTTSPFYKETAKFEGLIICERPTEKEKTECDHDAQRDAIWNIRRAGIRWKYLNTICPICNEDLK